MKGTTLKGAHSDLSIRWTSNPDNRYAARTGFVAFVAALRERGAKGPARNARKAGFTEASYRNGVLRVSETVNLRFQVPQNLEVTPERLTRVLMQRETADSERLAELDVVFGAGDAVGADAGELDILWINKIRFAGIEIRDINRLAQSLVQFDLQQVAQYLGSRCRIGCS